MARRSFLVSLLLVAVCHTGAQQFPVTQLPYNSIQEYINGDTQMSMLLQLAGPSYNTLSQTNLRATVFVPNSDAVLTYLYQQYGVSELADLWSDPGLNQPRASPPPPVVRARPPSPTPPAEPAPNAGKARCGGSELQIVDARSSAARVEEADLALGQVGG
ncbi:hypothetical protein GPECTOR_80g163 [Gonium pectorale]|uniref:FAS1 domain-containing protein n=1 Tax=Gonium pectorale TaxID=33097 RepID=A0A150G1U6_GONPE|nr:hypothetical protein GPECTOR_80g163 [Gonium pectorale]|eukprot:KXZ43803.1 hypothetical protein GPECTOR_80g163 [Gonium pectorale]